MVTRRGFLKAATVSAGMAILDSNHLLAQTVRPEHFALNEFVESHPDAVFVLRTNVDQKTNTSEIRAVGRELGKTLFVGTRPSEHAFPVTGNVVIKPNATMWAWESKGPTEPTMGIQTDPHFVEGLIGSLNDLSVRSDTIHISEANYSAARIDGASYRDMAARTGIKMKETRGITESVPTDVQWDVVPDGLWFRRIPHLWPVNSSGSCLINVAKLKSHSMGMTLCCKNLQGTVAWPYVEQCTAWGTPIQGVDAGDVVPNAFATIRANYERRKESIPRWKTLDGDDGAGSAGGLWMETHSSRCLDNNSVLSPMINIIEGVYGREGPFVSGPSTMGVGVDHMTNVVIFGKNARHVDIVGTYLSGHEPGNFGFFHMALERGLSKFLDPHDIPMYEWRLDGSASLTSLASFPRVSLRTTYLRQAGEPEYHMVDQPYDYSSSRTSSASPPTESDVFALQQSFPYRPDLMSIQYHIPTSGKVRIEILDDQGQVVDLLLDSYVLAGDHLVRWRSQSRAAGTYICHMLFDECGKTSAIVLN